jgi:predicted ATPase/class 3 adenylate cyclase
MYERDAWRVRRDLPSGTVTFLFTDVEGSTRLLHALGAETYAAALAEHRRIIREACARGGGVEVDTQGDAFFFAFPTAAGAISAAAAFTDALVSGEIQVRVGLHTGTPLLTAEGYVGDDVHFAARVAATSHGGQIVLSAATAELVEEPLTPLGSHRLKDISEPVSIYQLGGGTFPPLKTIANTNLPTPASSFLGREDELHAADQLLQRTRLLTISGPGGQGKTRFALELAGRVREKRFGDYADGVFSCFLASLKDPALVLPAVARTLDVKERPGSSDLDALAAHLQGKRMLILLDNLEHLLAAAPELAQLLRRAAGLTLLVTSRELMRIEGETSYALPPLPEPESVALFCERAQLEPSEEISELCHRLEGLPLALELAAARTAILTPAQLLERLSLRLDLLKGGRDADPRQQTLRATIEWSHDLLSPAEQRLLARLSVFVGGCTLEAAEAVADADLDSLHSLVDKSLLRFTDERFWMLETIREYAAERLEKAGEAGHVRSRHARFVSSSLAEPPLLDRAIWAVMLESERQNLRSALNWALGNETSDVGLALASQYGWACMLSGPLQDGRSLLVSALEQGPEEDTWAYARALWGLGALEWRLGDLDAAIGCHERCLEIARRIGDRNLEGRALRALGIAAAEAQDVAASEVLLGDALAVFRGLGDRAETDECLHMLGWAAMVRGDYAVAGELIEEALTNARATGDTRGVTRCASNLAFVASEEGRFGEALELAREGLIAAHELSQFSVIGEYLAELARVTAELGDLDRSARLLGGADAINDATESTLDSRDVARRERTTAILSRGLGPDRAEQLVAAGRGMEVDDLVAAALGYQEAVTVGGTGPRSRRQQ